MLADQFERAAGNESHSSLLNILILYDNHSLHVNTIRDHLECFSLYSRHHIYYAPATGNAPVSLSLDLFDVVIIQSCVRLSLSCHLSPDYAKALESYRGLKVLFIQDEYDNPYQACDWINRLGIRVVFTNVPDSYRRRVYPHVDHACVEFFLTLTGYVPPNLDRRPLPPPLSQRPAVIGYRGRDLPYVYGKLGQEKKMIGVRMRAICEERGIRHDIEWTSDKRIYGDGWFDFLASCRATLGTESGSNVFDFDGSLGPAIQTALQQDPTLDFDAVFERFLRERETEVIMNQISPRAFETIAVRTGLILFEGRYSGVLQPDVHFIPLRKDFSNVDEVLAKVQDDGYLGAMIERAYGDIIESGRYSYPAFVREVEQILEARSPRGAGNRLVARVVGPVPTYTDPQTFPETLVMSKPINVQPLIDRTTAAASALTECRQQLAESERQLAESRQQLAGCRQQLAEVVEGVANSLREEVQQLRHSWSLRAVTVVTVQEDGRAETHVPLAPQPAQT